MATVKRSSRRVRKQPDGAADRTARQSETRTKQPRRKTGAQSRKPQAGAKGAKTAKRAKGAKVGKGGKRKAHTAGASSLRFGLASVLRLSDRFAAGLVASYDRAFGLDVAEKADIHLQVGIDCVSDGRHAEAVEVLRQALDLDPKSAPAWFHLGLALLDQQAPQAAVEAFGEAREHGADGFDLCYRMAEALDDLDDHEGAVAELRKALEEQPDEAEAWYRLGVALDKLERYPEATTTFETAIELSPREVTYHQALGFCFDSMNEHQKAVKCLKRAAELERRSRR